MIKKNGIAVGSMLVVMLATGASAGSETDTALLLELKKMIEQQQQQLDQQAEEISRLKEMVGAPVGGEQTQQAGQPQEKTQAESPADKPMVSTLKNVDVNLYGQLNKGVLYADPGDAGKVSIVDKNNSQSRIGINASVSPTEEWNQARIPG